MFQECMQAEISQAVDLLRPFDQILLAMIQRARVRDMVLARYQMIDGPYPKFEEKTS